MSGAAGRVYPAFAPALFAVALREDPALWVAGQPGAALAAGAGAGVAGGGAARDRRGGAGGDERTNVAAVSALRVGGVVPGAGGAAAAVQSRATDYRHIMSTGPHAPPQPGARKPNRRSVPRLILFATGIKRAQVISHAQDDAIAIWLRGQCSGVRLRSAGFWARWQPLRVASSQARRDSGRYFTL